MIDPDTGKLQVPSHNPPPYESAAGVGADPRRSSAPAVQESSRTPTTPPRFNGQPTPGKSVPYAPNNAVANMAPPIHFPLPPSFAAGPGQQSYIYHDIRSGQLVASILPPDNPHMLCLTQGQHDYKTRFGLLGIIAAIVWFPIGIACCLLDRRIVCRRCGVIIDDGISC